MKKFLTLFVLICPLLAMAQQTRQITGQVLDRADGTPLVGATVFIAPEETQAKDYNPQGTIAYEQGRFAFKLPASVRKVVVSYLGYEARTLDISGKSDFTIYLSASDNKVDAVVVTGYQRIEKRKLTSSISSVKMSDISRDGVASVDEMLSGSIAGLVSTPTTGGPGAASKIKIRSTVTLNGNTDPLWVLDGMPLEGNDIPKDWSSKESVDNLYNMSIAGLNPSDIEDITVLKDAAATAIYGVRGANGVILITTREGIVGKPQINIRFEAGMVQPTKVPDMLDAVQFAELWNAAAGSEVYTPEVIQKYRDGSDPDLYPNVDWVDYLYKDLSFNERVNVNVTGGGSTAKYYISGGFYNEDGLFARDNMKEYNTSVFFRKFNFRSNVEVQLHKYTKLNVNLATTFERKNEPGTAASTIWNYAVKSAPNVFPAVYSNGLLPGPGANNGENPYVLLTQTGYREKFYNTAQSLFSLTQDLGDWVTKGLTVTVKGSFDAKNYNHLARTKTPPQYMASGRDEFGDLILQQKVIGADNLTYSESHSGYRSVYLEASVNWARSFGKHDLSALFLYQQSQRNDVGIDKSQPELALPYRHQGIAGRITYSYDNRYFIEGNFGYNGSENFSPGKRFGFFPSVAAGYVISNEKFFEPVRGVIDLLKIKASYGIVGNDKIGTGDNVRRFIYNETVVPGNSYNFGTSTQSYAGTRLGDWANPNVGWEEAHKLNVGVDLSLFSKLKISADYFKERREGIFLKRASIPVYVGLSTKPWVNIGKMRNSGVDASLEYHQTIGQDLHLTVRGNFTYARNMIVDQDQPDYKYLYMNRTGQARYQTFGLVAAGLFRDQADIDAWPKQSFGDVEPGDIKYLDLNGDNIVNGGKGTLEDPGDRRVIGNSSPRYQYGLTLNLSWYGFDLSVFMQGIGRLDWYPGADNLRFWGPYSRPYATFIPKNFMSQVWSESNPDAYLPRARAYTSLNSTQGTAYYTNDRYLQNLAYCRLKNLTLGYTIPKRLTSKVGIKECRVYFSGENLATWSALKNDFLDPEQAAADSDKKSNVYPWCRTYSVGLNLTF